MYYIAEAYKKTYGVFLYVAKHHNRSHGYDYRGKRGICIVANINHVLAPTNKSAPFEIFDSIVIRDWRHATLFRDAIN